jgi:hypothetical protein
MIWCYYTLHTFGEIVETSKCRSMVARNNDVTSIEMTVLTNGLSLSQWPRGLRGRSAAARLLRSWIRIPPGGMDVCLLWVLCVVR